MFIVVIVVLFHSVIYSLCFTVGNIPYEATEEQLKEIFTQAGPVSSFRWATGFHLIMYCTFHHFFQRISGLETNARPLARGELNSVRASGSSDLTSPVGEWIFFIFFLFIFFIFYFFLGLPLLF